MNDGFNVLPNDLAKLRATGRLQLSRSPITRMWRIALPEAGVSYEAPSRHLLYDQIRAAAQRVGML
jgi:hypothetical protein